MRSLQTATSSSLQDLQEVRERIGLGGLFLLIIFQMHSKNGPSLPLDLELRFSLYTSPLHALSVLRNCWNVIS